MSYQTLAAPCQAIYDIKKSQFLAFAYPIDDREQAMACVMQLKEQYPDARHHCYGYVIGNPHNTTSAGFDDDGEPNGTAGRPILNVLQHKGIGNVIIVVVRYFGGIKLGAGGLTRAYGTAAQLAVEQMVLVPFVARCQVSVQTTFAHEAQIRYLVSAVDGQIVTVDYANQVQMSVQMDLAKRSAFIESLGVFGQVLDEEGC
ncbi:YigZ family protein [Moraxella sp.]|uniref:YigZ family protein n=1 Tax=Moraxella sp. TaxID=479 RepID=UPI0026DCAF80|nr:YigZ family protein [Moraxella sp.]MDO4894815.1 YigZ family protein [Moraxella sp.]